jgi:hypothetical protein
MSDRFVLREDPDATARVVATCMAGQVVDAVDRAAWSRDDAWLEVALMPDHLTGWIERGAVRPFGSHGSRWAETLQYMISEASQSMMLHRSQSETATISAHEFDAPSDSDDK